MAEIKLTEEERSKIRTDSLNKRTIFNYKDIYINGDIDDLIESINETRKDILTIDNVDPHSLDIGHIRIEDEWDDSLTFEGLRINYEVEGVDSGYFDRTCKELLEHKNKRYKQYKILKEEFGEYK